jgi:hypothetical protein
VFARRIRDRAIGALGFDVDDELRAERLDRDAEAAHDQQFVERRSRPVHHRATRPVDVVRTQAGSRRARR